MFDLTNTLEISPFSLNKSAKLELYSEAVQSLTRFHFENCQPYQKLLNKIGFVPDKSHLLEEYPFLPVRLFKEYKLVSVDSSKIIKEMNSSGTTGQSVSRIFLDRATASNQTRVLAKIVSSFIGTKRLPLLIIDNKSVVKNRNVFSARGAGILGFSLFGVDVTYALNEDMSLDFDAVQSFCEKHRNENILLFGFTYIVWKHFFKPLRKSGETLALENASLLHGGGWKKLFEEAVDNREFNKSMKNVCGIKKVHNYYGMVEQTGSIFIECESGFLHCSIFSDIITRRADFTECEFGETGIVELLSLLPQSYPGHIILTEDEGEIIGEDDCPCGRLGKYFKIHGRIKNAEIRGCSDVYTK
jgi:phenylacetate-coenzyme A ligase PaaK-like adenylate-forming protein